MVSKKVLVVDDDQRITRLVAELLQTRDFQVDIAHQGSEALAKVHHCPDVILLDRRLPDMEGLEICRRIREDKRFRGIPIIILSGRDTVSDKIEGLYFGADDYITKPYDNEELVARVEAVLRRSHFAEYLHEEKETLIEEARNILQNKLVEPYFQPIFSLETKKPIGYEVLSRPPQESILNNPEILFKVALTYGMYFDLEMICWEKASRIWRQSRRSEKLFLNCMPYLIEHDKFDQNLFVDRGMQMNNCVLEITERMAIKDFALFHSKLKELKGCGLKIAVDDVGSGYASLDTIANTRPDYVKIDISLVHDVDVDSLKQGIFEAITSFCHKNNIYTIAEGIERKEELEKIRSLGVQAAQGFLFSPPIKEINKGEDISSIINP